MKDLEARSQFFVIEILLFTQKCPKLWSFFGLSDHGVRSNLSHYGPRFQRAQIPKSFFRTKNISFERAVGCIAWKRATWDAPYNPPTGGVVFNTVHWLQTSIDVLTHTGSASLAQYYLTSEFKRKSCIQGSRCYRTTWCKVKFSSFQ